MLVVVVAEKSWNGDRTSQPDLGRPGFGLDGGPFLLRFPFYRWISLLPVGPTVVVARRFPRHLLFQVHFRRQKRTC